MKIVTRIFINAIVLTVICFLLAFCFSSAIPHTIQPELNEVIKNDYSDYKSVIGYGALEQYQKFDDVNVVLSSDLELFIPDEAELCCSIGKQSKNSMLYVLDGINYCCDSEITITSVLHNQTGGYVLTYYLSKSDYIIIGGTKADYYRVDVGDKVKIAGSLLVLRIASKELIGEKTIFKTETEDLHIMDNEVLWVDICIEKTDSIYWIKNEALTEKIGNDLYKLHIYNPHSADGVAFYEKIISVKYYDSFCSIVVDGTLNTYERVLLPEE